MSLIAGVAGSLGGLLIAINDASIVDNTTSPTTCSVSYQLTSGGVVNSITTNGGTVALQNWARPLSVAGAAYEARATILTGSLTSGTTGTWLPLNVTRTWNVQRSTSGVSTCTMTMEIRRASDLVVLDSAAISLQAQRDV